MIYHDESVLHLDATALKVLAHPLRTRLLSQLRTRGPATATQLADRLDTNTGATSYHLRKLEQVGIVRDTGDGSGKQRLWEAATRGHSWWARDFAGDPDAEAALVVLERQYAQQHTERLGRWMDESSEWGVEWRDAAGLGDDGVTVTAEQLLRLREEIWALIMTYRDAGEGNSQARKVNIAVAALPNPGQTPP